MELRKILFRKEAKLVTLLLTSLLIATASATVYYSMNMEPTVTIDQATVIFEEGADAATNACNVTLGTNPTWASLSIKAYPNVTLTYTEALNISNTDSDDHDVYLTPVSISPNGTADVANFTFINFTLIQSDGNPVTGGALDYTVSGNDWVKPSDMTAQTLTAGTEWALKIETKAVGGATDGIDVTIVIAVNVQE